jgi:hypothetical protein
VTSDQRRIVRWKKLHKKFCDFTLPEMLVVMAKNMKGNVRVMAEIINENILFGKSERNTA